MIALIQRAVAAHALCVAACSPPSTEAPKRTSAEDIESFPHTRAPAPRHAPAPTAEAAAAPTSAHVLTPGGLGVLKIGQNVPAGSGWGERYAQIPGPCRTISSPDVPGVHAIVEEGEVRRITVGERSEIKLKEGIGPGASEAEVRAAFPNYREEPHKYVEAPGKYLTAPHAAKGDPALRFEIGRDGKVSLIHAGTMPMLGYVEGCA